MMNTTQMTKKRRLAAILFADIEGYTALMQSDERKALIGLNKFKKELEIKVRTYHGEIIQFYGDGCLAIFHSSVEATGCAEKLQATFQQAPIVPVRIGLHLGEVIFKDNNVFGDAVNIASRIESMGIAGSVLLSNTVRNQLKNQTLFELTPLGKYDFKNVKEPIEVFALANKGLAIPSKTDLLKGKKSQRKGGLSKSTILAIVGVLLLFVGWIGFQIYKTNATKLTTPLSHKIAVLPLKNLSSEEENLGFANGITQEIIDELAKISAVKVSAFTLASFYNLQEMPPEKVAEGLNVNYLISGTSRIIKSTNRVKVSLTLFNPYTKESIWNESFDKPIADAATIQLAVAKQVSNALGVQLDPKITFSTPNTNNGRAFRLFLHAKSEIAQLLPNSLKRGEALLREAIELDPNYTQAYTLLAFSYNLSNDPQLVADVGSTEEIINLIDPVIDKSLQLNPNSSDAYLVRASSHLFVKNQLKDALADVDKALELNSWPTIPTNYCICIVATTYVAAGKSEKANRLVALARQIDPGNVFVFWDEGGIKMSEGKYAKATELYKQSASTLDIPYFNAYVGLSLYHDKKYAESLSYFQKAYTQAEGGRPLAIVVAYLSNIYYLQGKTLQANRYLKELEGRQQAGEHHLNQFLSLIYLARNDNEKALDYLEKGQNEYGLAVMLGLDPSFQQLQEEARFIAIRKTMQYYDN